ncbi:MAG: TRAP transporter small permease subunit [Proteobacteria bacterium]|nr:TRAP transporter small permease subunit [Pseudomonadota bacterium]MCP4918259.1 TRAP transporter small permease subunit [Pseudomonadota bacterium]
MTALLRVSRWIDGLSELVGKLVGVLVLGMVCLGAFNALARYASRFMDANLSSNAFIEGQWYLFSLVFLLGAGATLARDQHVRVDVFYGRLSPKKKAWIDLLGTILFLLPFCGFALYVSVGTVMDSWAVWEVSPDPGGLPRWPIKTMILVSFTLLGIQGVSELIKRIAVLTGDIPLPEEEA